MKQKRKAKSKLPTVTRIPDSSSEDDSDAPPEKIRVVSNFVAKDGTVRRSVVFQEDHNPVYRPPSPSPYREAEPNSYHGDDSDADVHDDADVNDPSDDIEGYAVEAFLGDGYLSTRLGRVTIEDADEDEDEDEGSDRAHDGGLHPGHDPPILSPSDTPKIKPLDEWRPLRDAVLLSMHSLDAPPATLVCPGMHPVDDGPPREVHDSLQPLGARIVSTRRGARIVSSKHMCARHFTP